MTLKVGINGFGRIGRNILRSIIENNRKDLNVVAVNNTASLLSSSHLLKYDSVQGRFPSDISINHNSIDVGRGPIIFSQERDIVNINWKDRDVDIVLECTGKFNSRQNAEIHIENGAKRVLFSAPASDVDITIVLESPKLQPIISKIINSVAHHLEIDINRVNIKATTSERMGFVGREEGIACYATVLIEKI